jgi:hypothetical protein
LSRVRRDRTLAPKTWHLAFVSGGHAGISSFVAGTMQNGQPRILWVAWISGGELALKENGATVGAYKSDVAARTAETHFLILKLSFHKRRRQVTTSPVLELE